MATFLQWCGIFERFWLPAVCACSIAQAAVGQEVQVRLRSGRSFTAQLDEQTSTQRLVLRFERPGAQILRPIAWQSVDAMLLGDRSLSPAEVLKLIEAGRLPTKPNPFTDDAEEIPAADELASERSAPDDVQTVSQAAPSVRAIHIEAQVANWDGDVENDGILLRVYPLDEEGGVVAARGTLDVELIAQVPATKSYGNPVEHLERWSRIVAEHDVAPSGAIYKLPFGSAHPDFDPRLGSMGAVHARFSVPGSGTFEDTAGMVRIREYSSVRDRLEQLRGVRFFDNERTGRGVRSLGRP